MRRKPRKTGISVIGAVPWGTHLCLFYDTKQDLVDILVPYFQAGLENNEFCIWVTSEPLGKKGAKKAMRQAVPNFAQYPGRGQIEFIPHTEWYLKRGAFNLQRVLNAWIDKLDQALDKGYEGMRVTGNESWLEEKIGGDFTSYEEAVNNVIGNYRMLAICAYPLDMCGASEVIDVVGNHRLALIKQAGNWVLSKPMREQKMAPQATSKRHLTLLRQRFIELGFEGFGDQEILELLLSLALPYRESQRLAEECLKEFKDLSGVFGAPPRELERVGVTPTCMFYIKLLRELPAQILKKKIIEQPFYESSKDVFDYLYYSMRDLEEEVFKVIYLNSRNQIIDTFDLFKGTLRSIVVQPQAIVANAIKHGSAAVIFAHNHPAGDPVPSRSDERLTRDLVFVGEIIQIKVLDHIIIGGNKYFSFADAGLIEKYRLDFLNFKIRGVSDSRVSHSEDSPSL